MDNLVNLIKLLPKYSEVAHLVDHDHELSHPLRLASKNLQNFAAKCVRNSEWQIGGCLLHKLVNHLWEEIHSGHFSQIPEDKRKVYSFTAFYYVLYLLLDDMPRRSIENCSKHLDRAILLSGKENMGRKGIKLTTALMKVIDKKLGVPTGIELPVLKPIPRKDYKQDIGQVDGISVSSFRNIFLRFDIPVLILNSMKDWPAMTKWRDLKYLLKVAGNRTVPIEIGAHYTAADWSQQLVKMHDFLARQFGSKENQDNDVVQVEYLAQHELFDQIPELRSDIKIPIYCSESSNFDNTSVKAWLGPKGTVSPLHYDPRHNFLCQVFGVKFVVLAAPEDTPNLYKHEGEMLDNTSRLDVGDIDYYKFPLAKNAKFYKVLVQEGDCLFIPKGWWHYIRAESESFSVSFWWD